MGVRVSVYDMSERQRFLSSVCVCVCRSEYKNMFVYFFAIFELSCVFVFVVRCVKCLTLLLY